jgi:N-acetylmuramoyl-L-alanine amidase
LKQYPILILIVGTGLLLATGCGSPPPQPAVVDIPGYEALQEQFTGRDMSPLRSRRIVLDPGHGGFFKGAVGQDGLTEADVNLGVALYLRGLLEWTGARVYMTRTADYDFLTVTDSTLVSDLAFRSSFSDSLQPDVFLSLHHNSVASLDRTVNETQTYYPLGADGASLDLARAIHRHLVINLEISPAKILPGNFHVLRNATVPAVLGEPAMISNPVIEGRLKQAASQRLEAEAYFLGLLDYFSQGSPTWSGARLDTLFVSPDGSAPMVSWTFFSADTLGSIGPGPDPGTFELKLDGRKVPYHVTGQGRTVNWLASDPGLSLPAVLELRGRNLVGRATPVRRTLLRPTSAHHVSLRLMPEVPHEDGFMAVRWSVAGNAPLPKGRLVFSEDLILPLEGGKSGAALLPLSAASPAEVSFHPASVEDSNLPCDIHTTELPEPWQWRLLTGQDGSPDGPWSLRTGLPDSLPAGMADQEAPLIPHEPSQPVWVSVPGVLPLVDPDPANPDTARTVSAGDRNWPTESIVPGLRDKVIVLDPAGGGSDPDGTGPLGMRGATLNLETAMLAQGLLEGCGAVVHLTRSGETSLPAEEKVRLAGEVGADFFISIGRSSQPDFLSASHHPGSETGQRWAEIFLDAAAGLSAPNDSLAVTPSYDYLLRHTACPALEVRLPGPKTPRQEMRLAQRGWQRAEARAVLLSLASMLSHPGTGLVPVLDVAAVIADLPGSPDPAEVDWAELDGNLLWSPISIPETTIDGQVLSPARTDSLDSPGGPGLPALLDRHTLEINAGAVRQLWLLERSGSGFTARLMMNNP